VTGPINVGNPTEFTILEPAHLVSSSRAPTPASCIGKGRTMSPRGDPMQRRSDNTQARELLCWRALRDGLVGTIAYFKLLLAERGIAAALRSE
jgi:UDP-glucuronate decarboxylase